MWCQQWVRPVFTPGKALQCNDTHMSGDDLECLAIEQRKPWLYYRPHNTDNSPAPFLTLAQKLHQDPGFAREHKFGFSGNTWRWRLEYFTAIKKGKFQTKGKSGISAKCTDSSVSIDVMRRVNNTAAFRVTPWSRARLQKSCLRGRKIKTRILRGVAVWWGGLYSLPPRRPRHKAHILQFWNRHRLLSYSKEGCMLNRTNASPGMQAEVDWFL